MYIHYCRSVALTQNLKRFQPGEAKGDELTRVLFRDGRQLGPYRPASRKCLAPYISQIFSQGALCSLRPQTLNAPERIQASE
jgi:hypothetical protein